MAKKKDLSSYRGVFTIVVLIAIGCLLAYGLIGTSFRTEDDIFRITGLHSQKIDYSEIASVTVGEELPTITARTGGFSLGGKKLGNFTTTEYGKVKLFLFNSIKPFIYIELDDGDMVILNMNDPADTQELYKELTARLN